jgi:hypothetical protein
MEHMKRQLGEMDWSDTRPIEEINFALDMPDSENARARVREVFLKVGCKTADDAAEVGCTGLAAAGFSIEDSVFVRQHMAGAGFGLTCFVPQSRFCLVHNVIGGLQENQDQRHPEMVDKISRELTTKERGHVELIESSRRIEGRKNVMDALAGRKLPTDFSEDADSDSEEAPTTSEPSPFEPFECQEHGETLWSCRFCVAAEVAKGSLVPKFAVGWTVKEGDMRYSEATASVLADHLSSNANDLTVFVKVARFTRKLSRV